MHFYSLLSLLFIVTLLSADSNKSYKIDHLEPPFWWTDLADNTLQLMVHGKNISKLEPKLSYPGVEIKQVHRLDNPNYLFIDLHLSEITKPGNFDIYFIESDQRMVSYSYELLKRKPGSEKRQGFTPADVIYLITPDRYANGNPKNHSIPLGNKTPNERDLHFRFLSWSARKVKQLRVRNLWNSGQALGLRRGF